MMCHRSFRKWGWSSQRIKGGGSSLVMLLSVLEKFEMPEGEERIIHCRRAKEKRFVSSKGYWKLADR